MNTECTRGLGQVPRLPCFRDDTAAAARFLGPRTDVRRRTRQWDRGRHAGARRGLCTILTILCASCRVLITFDITTRECAASACFRRTHGPADVAGERVERPERFTEQLIHSRSAVCWATRATDDDAVPPAHYRRTNPFGKHENNVPVTHAYSFCTRAGV